MLKDREQHIMCSSKCSNQDEAGVVGSDHGTKLFLSVRGGNWGRCREVIYTGKAWSHEAENEVGRS
jgi:hypothetical protein